MGNVPSSNGPERWRYRFRLWHLSVLLPLVTMPCVWRAWRQAWVERRLDGLSVFRRFIESEYEEQIDLIERTMSDDIINDDEFFFEGATEYIQEALSATDICDASWSDDGHHNVQMLKHGFASLKYMTDIASRDSHGLHFLYYGTTLDANGVELLVFKGIVPTGKMMRVYTLVFHLDTIDAKLKRPRPAVLDTRQPP